MTIIFGFLAATLPDEHVRRLAMLSEADGTDEVALSRTGLVVNARVGAAQATDRILATTVEGVSILLIGRPVFRKGEQVDLGRLGWDEVADSLRKIDGYWIAFAYDETKRRLKVLCDRLGVGWIYWAQTPSGIAFSSDFQALLRLLPGPARLDETSCVLSLTITYPLGSSTCFAGISLVSPETALEFHDGRVREEQLDTLDYGDRWVGVPRDAKLEALDAALDGSFQTWSSDARQPWTVALSSGKDSRYGLGLLLKHAQRPGCITFGRRGSPDAKGATATCRREGLTHHLFHPEACTSWDSWKSSVQRLGVVAGFQYVAGWGHEWRRALSAQGGQVVLGFLGDALSGHHLVDRFRGDWLANWEAWSLDLRADGSWTGSQVIRPEIRARVRESIRAALCAEIAHREFPLPHQLALHLDLFSRQRRAAASQINFLTDEVAVAPLFYTTELLEFWANVEYEDLRSQALYLDFARARYPRLFAPPQRPRLIDRAKGTLVNLAADTWPSLGLRLKPPEIDTGTIVNRHLDDLRRLTRDCADAVAHIVDIPALHKWLAEFGTHRGPEAQELLRFWNFFMLVEAGLAKRSTPH